MATKLPAILQSATPISDLIEALEKAGAPIKAIILAVKAVEAWRHPATALANSDTATATEPATEIAPPIRYGTPRKGMTNAERSRLFRERQRALRNGNRNGETVADRNGETVLSNESVAAPPAPPLVTEESLKVDDEKKIPEEQKDKETEVARVASQEIVDLWNRFAKWCNERGVCATGTKVSLVATVTEKRRKAIRERLKTYSFDVMRDGLNVARRTPGVLGHNDRKWTANIDWFLRPDTIAKLLEGNYENWTQSTPIQSARQSHAEAARAAVAGQRRIITGESEEGDYGEPGGTGFIDAGVVAASE